MKEIPVHRYGKVYAHALVDDDDFEALSRFRWTYSAGYAVRGTTAGGRSRTFPMAREIMGLAHGDPRQVDHRSRNTLDNQRANLRIATHAQNKQNLDSYRGSTSRFRGVSWDTRRGAWVASGKLDGRRRHLGYFDDEEEAARAAAAWRAENMPFSEEAAAA